MIKKKPVESLEIKFDSNRQRYNYRKLSSKKLHVMQVPFFENPVEHNEYLRALEVVKQYHTQINAMAIYTCELNEKKLSSIDLTKEDSFFERIKVHVSTRIYNAIYKHIESEILAGQLLLFSPNDFTIDHFLTHFSSEKDLRKVRNLSSKGINDLYEGLKNLRIKLN